MAKRRREGRPGWLKQGIYNASIGSHEPLIFRRRRGGLSADEAERWFQQEHAEEQVRRAAELGVEMIHTHFYKGFGLEAERRDIEMAAALSRLVHAHGMRLDTYVVGTFSYETLCAEEPRAKGWAAVNGQGEPITYWANQTFRYRPCVNNEEYIDYLKRVIRIGVEGVKTDLFHFDNFVLVMEPQSCRCKACQERFRAFLKGKYTPEELEDRLGFTNLDCVAPPRWDVVNPPWNLEVIDDPLIQEWIDFRCQRLADYFGKLAAYIRGLNPEIAVECNPQGVDGSNRAFLSGVDFPRLLAHGDVFWTEERNPSSLTEDGRLISKIRTFKVGRALDNVVFAYHFGERGGTSYVGLAEALAFNQTPGVMGHIDGIASDPGRKVYIDFYLKHRDLYTGTEDVVDVGVLRSFASLAYNNYSTHLSTILLEQVLIQTKAPFGIVFDEDLEDLSGYRVLALGNVECLSDRQVELIRAFVRGGGGLVATDETSLYTEWRRRRRDFGLGDLFGVSAGDRGSGPVRRRAGAGRVVYVPRIAPAVERLPKGEVDVSHPIQKNFWNIDNRYWRLPRNWDELHRAVVWAAGGSLSVEVDAPLTTVVNLTRKGDGVCAHLVNYDCAHPVRGAGMDLRVEAGRRVGRVRLLSPDGGETDLEFEERADRVQFFVPELRIYSVVAVEMVKV